MKQVAKVSVHACLLRCKFPACFLNLNHQLLVDFDFSQILKVNLLLRYLKSFDQVPQELP